MDTNYPNDAQDHGQRDARRLLSQQTTHGHGSRSVSPHHQTYEELQALKPYPVQHYPSGYAPAGDVPALAQHQQPTDSAAAAAGQFYPVDQNAPRVPLAGIVNPQQFRQAEASFQVLTFDH